MRELAGLFAIEVCGYVTLLDWTGRELRADKRGAIPDHLAPIMERLVSGDTNSDPSDHCTKPHYTHALMLSVFGALPWLLFGFHLRLALNCVGVAIG
jgi:hypothetical protein